MQIAQHWKPYFKKNVRSNTVQCLLCSHNCIILDGKTGLCNVRLNKVGKLYSLNYAKPVSIAIDPIEKKPLFHFHPGKNILSFGTYGCNFSCKNCQNYDISKEFKVVDIQNLKTIPPEEIVKQTIEYGLDMIAYTYNESTVFYEYMKECMILAKKNNIKNVMVTNGFIEKKPLLEIVPYLDAANIDLKSFNEEMYTKMFNGRLKPILHTIKTLSKKCHIEITTLIIPGINDSEEEVRKIAQWILKNCGKETPYHLSRFFPLYKLNTLEPTPVDTLLNLQKIARQYLSNVYVGNVR